MDRIDIAIHCSFTISVYFLSIHLGLNYSNLQGQWAWKNDLKGRCACEYGYYFEDAECQYDIGYWFGRNMAIIFIVFCVVFVAGCWICKWKKDSLFAPDSKMYSVFK